jgi:hypothetical protein
MDDILNIGKFFMSLWREWTRHGASNSDNVGSNPTKLAVDVWEKRTYAFWLKDVRGKYDSSMLSSLILLRLRKEEWNVGKIYNHADRLYIEMIKAHPTKETL